MSNAYSHKALQAASITNRVGRDPDGVVDNRPGVSHPNMPRTRSAAKNGKSADSRDLFSRDPQHGRDLVNNTHKAPGKQTDGKWVIGIGMRNPSEPKPKLSRKKTNKNKLFGQDEELALDGLESPKTIEEDFEPEDS